MLGGEGAETEKAHVPSALILGQAILCECRFVAFEERFKVFELALLKYLEQSKQRLCGC